jgi:hypothetical protein
MEGKLLVQIRNSAIAERLLFTSEKSQKELDNRVKKGITEGGDDYRRPI